jgi:hypothetical protein
MAALVANIAGGVQTVESRPQRGNISVMVLTSRIRRKPLAGRSGAALSRLGAMAAAALGLAGIASCGPRLSGPAGSAAASAREYVVAHRDQLQGEIAVGSGRTIYGLATVAGCQDSARLGRVLNKRYSELFSVPEPTGEALAVRVVRIMRRDPEMRCVDLITGPGGPFAPGRYQVLDQGRGEAPVLRAVNARRFEPPDR